MGGTKTSIPIEKIVKKESRAVAFSKRRNGLYAKAAQLCLLSGAKMAILATPISSNSNASFYSFGHSSVDSVVSAFLSNQRPREEEKEEEDDIMARRGLGFWWEDESLAHSDDPVKLRAAIDSISSTLQHLEQLKKNRREKSKKDKKLKKKKDVNLQGLDQTLDFASTSANFCIPADVPANSEGFNNNNQEHDRTLAIYVNNGVPENSDGCNQKQIVDYETNFEDFSMQLEKNGVDQNQTLDVPSISSSTSLCIQDDLPANSAEFNENNEEQDRILATSDNNNALSGNLDELDLDQIIDYETDFEGLLMDFEVDDIPMVTTNQNLCSESESVEDEGALVMSNNSDLCGEELDLDQFFDYETNPASFLISNQNMFSGSEDGRAIMLVNHKDFDEDNLKFSDYFNDLPSITTL